MANQSVGQKNGGVVFPRSIFNDVIRSGRGRDVHDVVVVGHVTPDCGGTWDIQTAIVLLLNDE